MRTAIERKKFYINGEWVEAKMYTKLLSPYSSEVLAEIPLATERDVKQAIAAADEARQVMAKMPA
ncbi:MAG: aldehyde dehydrogenase family protein, partial [Anoxybacillus ayderensis]|nr:aldehyde dehydrogenase family protein [Anoxybacillus ayderensis]